MALGNNKFSSTAARRSTTIRYAKEQGHRLSVGVVAFVSPSAARSWQPPRLDLGWSLPEYLLLFLVPVIAVLTW
jgi:hypothetical protein